MCVIVVDENENWWRKMKKCLYIISNIVYKIGQVENNKWRGVSVHLYIQNEENNDAEQGKEEKTKTNKIW